MFCGVAQNLGSPPGHNALSSFLTKIFADKLRKSVNFWSIFIRILACLNLDISSLIVEPWSEIEAAKKYFVFSDPPLNDIVCLLLGDQ